MLTGRPRRAAHFPRGAEGCDASFLQQMENKPRNILEAPIPVLSSELMKELVVEMRREAIGTFARAQQIADEALAAFAAKKITRDEFDGRMASSRFCAAAARVQERNIAQMRARANDDVGDPDAAIVRDILNMNDADFLQKYPKGGEARAANAE